LQCCRSDWKYEVVDQIAEDDKVATRLIWRATHDKGDYQSVSVNGKRFEWEIVRVDHASDGQLVETWFSFNPMAIQQSLAASEVGDDLNLLPRWSVA